MKKYASFVLAAASFVITLGAAVVFFNQSSVDSDLTQKPYSALFLDRYPDANTAQGSGAVVLNGITNIRINTIDGVSEPQVVVNPLNEQAVAVSANDFRLSGNKARIFYSLNGGKTFDFSVVPLSGINGFTEATDPSIAYGPDGSLYYGTVHYQSVGGGDGLFVNRSLDNGMTWQAQATEVMKNTDPLQFEDRPSIAADLSNTSSRGYVYAVWNSVNTGSARILFSRSTDKASSFQAPVEIASGAVSCADIKVGRDGRIVIAYISNDNSIYVVYSVNGGANFSAPVKAAPFTHSGQKVNDAYFVKNSVVKVKSFPNIAIDNTNGAIYIVYAGRNGNDLSDIFAVRSNDGTSWTLPVRVNNDNTQNDQINPDAVIVNGNLMVMWQDSRDDSANNTFATYTARTSDGMNFVNSRVSSSEFNPSGIALRNYIGDYNGLAVQGNDVFAVWTDGRDNTFDVYGAVVPASPASVRPQDLAVSEFRVNQNYPNPFNPSTVISYSLPHSGQVSIKLYSMDGQMIALLYEGAAPAGYNSFEFNPVRSGLQLTSGNYLYKVVYGNTVSAHKLTLLK